MIAFDAAQTYTLDQARAMLNQADSFEDLSNLIRMVSLDTPDGPDPGTVTLFYSGPMTTGDAARITSRDLVQAMMAGPEGDTYRVLDRSQAALMLESPAFLERAIALRDGNRAAAETYMYDPAEGPWAIISRAFAQRTEGEIRFVGPNALNNRVFALTELPELATARVQGRTIEGVPVEDLVHPEADRLVLNNNAFEQVRLASLERAVFGGVNAHAMNQQAALDPGVAYTDPLLRDDVQAYVANLAQNEAEQRLNTYPDLTDSDRYVLTVQLNHWLGVEPANDVAFDHLNQDARNRVNASFEAMGLEDEMLPALNIHQRLG